MHASPSTPRAGLRAARPLLAGAALLALTACLQDADEPGAPPEEKGFVLAVTSDYKTGSYSAYGLDSAFTLKDIEAIHSDAVVRHEGGDDIFVINRLGRDNIQVLDRKNLKTVMQIALPAASNPYDVALRDSLLYVGFYGLPKILVFRQSDGSAAGEIDLSAHADTADGKPETTELRFVDGRLYALLANLDTKAGFTPLQARLVRIDPATKEALALDLPYGNPVSLAHDSAGGRLYIPCRGRFFKPDFTLDLDGGIVAVDLAAFAVADTLATEEGLGGSLNTAHLHGGTLYMDLTAPDGAKAKEKITAIGLGNGQANTLLEADGYSIGGLAVDGRTGTLLVGDRKAGLRLLELPSGAEKAESKIDLGLPISGLAVIR